MLKEAYDNGALAALVDAGLVKEGGTTKEVAKTLWNTAKGKAKGAVNEVRNAASQLTKARKGGVGKKFLEGYKGEIPKDLGKHVIPGLEKTLLEKASPYLTTGAVGLGGAGALYGGYKGLQSLFPHADSDRFSHPIKALFGGDD